MNKKIAMMAVALLSLVLSQTSFAMHHKDGDKSSRMSHMSKQLNLTPEQQSKFKELKKAMHEEMKSARAKAKEIDSSLKEVTTAAKLDEAKLTSLIKQKTDLMAAMLKNKLTFKHKIYNMLDEQQKEKFKAFMKSKHQKRDSQPQQSIEKKAQY